MSPADHQPYFAMDILVLPCISFSQSCHLQGILMYRTNSVLPHLPLHFFTPFGDRDCMGPLHTRQVLHCWAMFLATPLASSETLQYLLQNLKCSQAEGQGVHKYWASGCCHSGFLQFWISSSIGWNQSRSFSTVWNQSLPKIGTTSHNAHFFKHFFF